MPTSIPGDRIPPSHHAPGSKRFRLLKKLKKNRREVFQQKLDINVVLTEIEDGLTLVEDLEFRNRADRRVKIIRKLIATTSKKQLDEYQTRIKKSWGQLKNDWRNKAARENLDNVLIIIIESLERGDNPKAS
jgi:hypothetical protein